MLILFRPKKFNNTHAQVISPVLIYHNVGVTECPIYGIVVTPNQDNCVMTIPIDAYARILESHTATVLSWAITPSCIVNRNAPRKLKVEVDFDPNRAEDSLLELGCITRLLAYVHTYTDHLSTAGQGDNDYGSTIEKDTIRRTAQLWHLHNERPTTSTSS